MRASLSNVPYSPPRSLLIRSSRYFHRFLLSRAAAFLGLSPCIFFRDACLVLPEAAWNVLATRLFRHGVRCTSIFPHQCPAFFFLFSSFMNSMTLAFFPPPFFPLFSFSPLSFLFPFPLVSLSFYPASSLSFSFFLVRTDIRSFPALKEVFRMGQSGGLLRFLSRIQPTLTARHSSCSVVRECKESGCCHSQSMILIVALCNVCCRRWPA